MARGRVIDTSSFIGNQNAALKPGQPPGLVVRVYLNSSRHQAIQTYLKSLGLDASPEAVMEFTRQLVYQWGVQRD